MFGEAEAWPSVLEAALETVEESEELVLFLLWQPVNVPIRRTASRAGMIFLIIIDLILSLLRLFAGVGKRAVISRRLCLLCHVFLKIHGLGREKIAGLSLRSFLKMRGTPCFAARGRNTH